MKKLLTFLRRLFSRISYECFLIADTLDSHPDEFEILPSAQGDVAFIKMRHSVFALYNPVAASILIRLSASKIWLDIDTRKRVTLNLQETSMLTLAIDRWLHKEPTVKS